MHSVFKNRIKKTYYITSGFIVLGIMTGMGNANAQSTLLGSNGAWEASMEKSGSKQVCFMGSEPIKTVGKIKGRSRSYLMVAHRPQEKSLNVVSYRAGYDFKPGSEVKIVIAKKTYKLFTDDGYAFAYDSKSDRLLVNTMIKSNRLKLTGKSKNNKTVTDTYSLKGFTAAYKRISKACKV